MNARDLAFHRLRNQQIAVQQLEQPGEVVARLGAVQAQDYPGALWSIGLRLPNATVAAVERAIAERTIVRTWPMRGTLHFVAAEDVRWLLALLTPRIVAGAAGRFRRLELDDEVFARSRGLLITALQGGKRLSRPALFQLLEANGIATAGQRGVHILWRHAQEGLLCFAAPEAKQQTFALLDEWIAPSRTPARDEALATLTRRYFGGHGPATLQDFMWWSGQTAADARAGVELARGDLVQEKVKGQTYWMAGDMPAPGHHAADGYLLPGFDEYLLGYRDRSAVLDEAHRGRIHPGNNGMFLPTVVIDGRVAGTWKRTFTKGAVRIRYSPFTSFGAADLRALANATARYGRFLSLPVAAGVDSTAPAYSL